MESELESFLHEQAAEGVVESKGAFTVAAREAIRKMAQFGLPRPGTWALKLVQAAVASASPGLIVSSSDFEHQFTFAPAQPWTLSQVEEALTVTAPPAQPGLDHLRRGVWSGCLHDGRPFRLALPGCPQALIYDGKDLHYHRVTPPERLHLTVSLRTLAEGPKSFFLGGLQNQHHRREVAEELGRYGYACPIPLKLDGVRLDSLDMAVGRGYTSTSCPIALVTCQEGAPPFRLAPALAYSGDLLKFCDVVLQESLECPPIGDPLGPVAGAAWIALHTQRDYSEQGSMLVTSPVTSLCSWLCDGVVSEMELPFPALSVSCNLLISAQGLSTDLSGLETVDSPQRRARLHDVLQAIAPALSAVNFSLERWVHPQRTVLQDVIQAGVVLEDGLRQFSYKISDSLDKHHVSHQLDDYRRSKRNDSNAAQVNEVLHDHLKKLRQSLTRITFPAERTSAPQCQPPPL